ncbi:MAG: DNA methylase [Ruminococcaceae bacterium]|nr:DNA methylase [Oscillospiraceae bacterium]
MKKTYLCIDLKSFFASVECVERGLNPMTTNLVVADISRTEKTICLAVTPSLKALGISGRARLFEVLQRVKEVNAERRKKVPGRQLKEPSFDAVALKENPARELSYIVAPPQMARYIEYSTRIFDVYLRHVAPEDIHVYSIDEVFMDVTDYLKSSRMTAHEFAMHIIRDVLKTTGITATAGIGSNMYLAKIALDIMAKKMPADKDGVRIAELDEMSYRKELWDHRPLTDFWRVGKGYAKKLEANGLYTMGDVAEFSLIPYGEDKLYKLFGVNAELLIDHAWGWEPCTLDDIRSYQPDNKSIGEGQVLHTPYEFDKARLIVREMVELLSLKLLEQRFVTNQLVLTIGYDIENLTDPALRRQYKGEITTDFYGRKVPKHAHGSVNLGGYTSSTMLMAAAALELFDRIVDKKLLVRRVNITANHVIIEGTVEETSGSEQLDLFTDYAAVQEQREQEAKALKKERAIAETTLKIKKRYGKNAILKGFNFQEGATSRERNRQIGGHRAGGDEQDG